MSTWLETDYASVKSQLKKQFGCSLNKQQEALMKKLHKDIFCMCTLIYELSKFENVNAMEFLSEIRSDCIETLITIPLALKRSSYLSVRSAIEHTLLYIYYKDHPIELKLLRESAENRYTVTEIFKYLLKHPLYKDHQKLVDQVRTQYSSRSELVHAGSFHTFQQYKTISQVVMSDTEFEDAVKNIHSLVGDLITLVVIFHKHTFQKNIHHEFRTLIMSQLSQINKRRIHGIN
jgi:hypothetical protein